MDLSTAAHEQCYALVCTYLRQSFGEFAEPAEDRPSFFLDLGRHGICVDVQDVGEDDAGVSVYTWVMLEPVVSAELARRVLELNTEYRYGKFGLDRRGNLLYEHWLPAEGLGKRPLAEAIKLMAKTSDRVSDELILRFS